MLPPCGLPQAGYVASHASPRRSPRRTPRQHTRDDEKLPPLAADRTKLPSVAEQASWGMPTLPARYIAMLHGPGAPSPRIPRGVSLPPTQADVRRPYAEIDSSVAEALDDKVRELIRDYAKQDPDMQGQQGVFLIVERCHSCAEHHGLTTRHNEHQYAAGAVDLLEALKKSFSAVITETSELLANLEAQPRSLGSANWAQNATVFSNCSRCGAFEVYLVAPAQSVDFAAGTVAHYPARSTGQTHREVTVQGPLTQREQISGHPPPLMNEWGSRCDLSCGYQVTLLFSKLLVGSWPSLEKVARRLKRSLPTGILIVKVFDPAGGPSGNFIVEIEEQPKSLASTGAKFNEGPNDEGSRRTTETATTIGFSLSHSPTPRNQPVRFWGQGTAGIYQIDNVPLCTSLLVSISEGPGKPTSQQRYLSKSGLKNLEQFGAPRIFTLVCSDTPSGDQAVWALANGVSTSQQEGVQAFEGVLVMEDGTEVEVFDGKVRLPWHDFDPNSEKEQVASVLGQIAHLHVAGFQTAQWESIASGLTMAQLKRLKCVHVATLSPPELGVSVVTSCCGAGLPGAELRSLDGPAAVTSLSGHCDIRLRFGDHDLRLSHPTLSDGELINRVCMRESLSTVTLTIPPRIFVFCEEVQGRGGEPLATRIWASARRDSHPQSWLPFNGVLQSPKGDLHARCGITILPDNLPPQAILSEGGCPSPVCNCWVEATQLSLSPPSIRPLPPQLRPGEEIDEPEKTACGWLAMMQKPRLLGILPPTGDFRSSRPKPTPAPAVSVMISTRCCGAGLQSVSVEWDSSSGKGMASSETDTDGMCPVEGLSPGEHLLKIQHPRLPPQRFLASLTANDENTFSMPLVLPCLCEPQLYICAVSVGGEQLCQKVLLCGHLDCIPEGAAPFPGRVLILGGRRGQVQVLASAEGGEAFSPLPLSVSSYAGRCPASAIRLEVDNDEFLWCPVEPWPLTNGCACRTVLDAGTVELGVLRRFINVQHVTGQKFRLPNEDYRTVGDVRTHLAAELGLFSPPLGFVSGGGPLLDQEQIPPGQALQVLTRVLVRISLGSSRLPVPGVTVALENGECIQTDASGVCLLCAPPGENWVIATSRVFSEGEKRRHVRLKNINEELRFSADIILYIYMLKPEVEMDNASASSISEPCTVWVVGHRDLVPENALPVTGSAKAVLPSGQDASCTLNPTEVTVFSLPTSPPIDPAQADMVRSSPLPVANFVVNCESEGFIWKPNEPVPLCMDEAWECWPAAPLLLGKLCPAAEVVCHSLGNQKFSLPTTEFGTAGAVLSHLAPKLGILADRLAFFIGERRLTGREPVRPGLEYGIWPLAQIDVMICAPCCGAGLPGVHVALDEEDVDQSLDGLLRAGVRVVDSMGRNGVIDSVTSRACKVEFDSGSREVVPRANLSVSDDRKLGATNTAGICSFLSPVGEHQLCAWHPELGPGRGVAPSTTIMAERGTVNRCSMSVSMSVFLYAVAVPGNSKQVYLCSRRVDIPAGAEPVEGTLYLGSHEPDLMNTLPAGAVLSFSGSTIAPVDVQGSLTGYVGPCPLAEISSAIELDGFIWCPEGNSQPRQGCGLARVLRNPSLIGTLVPAVRVAPRNGRADVIEVPLYSRNPDSATAALVCYELAKRLGISREPCIGLFRKGSADPVAPEEVFKGGDQLEYVLLAQMKIVARTRCCGEPLVGAEVFIDGGTRHAMTDSCGQYTMAVELGHHEVSIRHRSLGDQTLSAQVDIDDSQGAIVEICSEVSLFAYITDPDGDGPDVKCSPKLVWVAGSDEQIPDDARPLRGQLQYGDGFKQELPDRLISSQLLDLAKEEHSGGSKCALCNLDVFADPPTGFVWKAKEPSPLAERIAEIGGCEYLRLRSCPVVMGFLKPMVAVRFDDQVEQIPLEGCGTIDDVRLKLAEVLQLDSGPTCLTMHSAKDGSKLLDTHQCVPGEEIVASRVGSVRVRMIMPCCSAPLTDVGVAIDGVKTGMTTDSCGLCELPVPFGEHQISMCCSAAHAQGAMSTATVTVKDGAGPECTISGDLNLYVYATDPEIEEGEESDASEPSCVWLCADAELIPDDYKGLVGKLTGTRLDGTEVSSIVGESVEPLNLGLSATARSGDDQQPCTFGSIRLECQRQGYRWCPKDPSPLSERVQEVGGCECLRVRTCPVALGFLKPLLHVYGIGGKHWELLRADFTEESELRSFLAQELSLEADKFVFHSADGTVLSTINAGIGSPNVYLVTQAGESVRELVAEQSRRR